MATSRSGLVAVMVTAIAATAWAGGDAAPAKMPSAADAARDDIKATFGFVPLLFQAVPDVALPGAWAEMKGLQMNPQTAIPGKYKEAIGLAVASQIPCAYCVYGHTQFMLLQGASAEEVKEAIMVAALDRHWSAIFNGLDLDEKAFRADVDKWLEAGKRMAAGKMAPPKPMEARTQRARWPTCSSTSATSQDHARATTDAPYGSLWLIDLHGAEPVTTVVSSTASVADDIGAFSASGAWLTWVDPTADTGMPTSHLRGVRVADPTHAVAVLGELPSYAELDHYGAAWQPAGDGLLVFNATMARFMDLDAGASHDWTFAQSYIAPAWSPDGRWFTATTHDDNNTSFETDLIDTQHLGAAPVRLLAAQPVVLHASWAADAEHLVVGTSPDNVTGPAVIFDVSSGAPVTGASIADAYGAWWIGSSGLVALTAGGLGFADLQGNVTGFGGLTDLWSAVPGRAAIDHYAQASGGRFYRPFTGTPVSIAACSHFGTAWSLDGSHVVCVPSPPDLVMYAVDSGAMTPVSLTSYGFFDTQVPPAIAWSGDGSVLVAADGGRLAFVDAVTGAVHSLASGGAPVGWRPAH